MKLKSVKPSTRSPKKYMAEFCNKDKCRIVHFGAKGYSDYTLHHDTERRTNYRKRHHSGKNAKPNTPNALAYHILWGDSTSLQTNIKAFKKKYSV